MNRRRVEVTLTTHPRASEARSKGRAPARRREEIHIEDLRHRSNGVSMAPKRPPVSSLGDRGRIELAAAQPRARFRDAAADINGISKIDLHVSCRRRATGRARGAGATP
jgi:hypothetical protein